MSEKQITYDIMENGKKVGTQTHPEQYAPVLQSGQTVRVAQEEKVREAAPSESNMKSATATPTKAK